MRGTYQQAAGRTNGASATSFRVSAGPRSACARIIEVAQALWPTKPDMALSHLTGKKDRTCRYWLQRKAGIPTEAFVALLLTDDGLKFLDGAMGETKPSWWPAFALAARIENLQREQLRHSKEIEQLAAEVLQ